MARPSAHSLGQLVQAYVDVQCDVLLESRDAISARDETQVHPTRVAIRRLRATLKTFRAVYETDAASRFAEDLAWFGILLGHVRDLQVLAERFDLEGGPDAEAERAIRAEIDRDRDRRWDAVVEALASVRGAELHATVLRWRDDPPFGDKADRPAAKARKRVAKSEARLQNRLERARAAAERGDDAAAELLHDARKAAKRHRYAVELAADVLGDDADEVIERGKALQDVLGEHQDAVVALAFLERVEADTERSAAAGALSGLVSRERERVEDIPGVLREVVRLRSPS